VFLVPKVGGASDLAIKIPTSQTQDWYWQSVNRTVDEFRRALRELVLEADGPPSLTNIDLDTGDRVKLGDYRRADQTYKQLLDRLTSKPEQVIPRTLKQNIIDYYAAGRGFNSEKHILERLKVLAGMKTTDGIETPVRDE